MGIKKKWVPGCGCCSTCNCSFPVTRTDDFGSQQTYLGTSDFYTDTGAGFCYAVATAQRRYIVGCRPTVGSAISVSANCFSIASSDTTFNSWSTAATGVYCDEPSLGNIKFGFFQRWQVGDHGFYAGSTVLRSLAVTPTCGDELKLVVTRTSDTEYSLDLQINSVSKLSTSGLVIDMTCEPNIGMLATRVLSGTTTHGKFDNFIVAGS